MNTQGRNKYKCRCVVSDAGLHLSSLTVGKHSPPSSPFTTAHNFTLKSMRRSRSPLFPLGRAAAAPPALPLFRHSIEGTGIQWTSRSNSLSPFLALICAGVSGKGREDAVTCAPMKRKMVQWTNSPLPRSLAARRFSECVNELESRDIGSWGRRRRHTRHHSGRGVSDHPQGSAKFHSRILL